MKSSRRHVRHTHAPRVLDRGDSDKAHGLALTHRESLSRFDTSRLRGVAARSIGLTSGLLWTPAGPLRLRRLTKVTDRRVILTYPATSLRYPKTLPVTLRMP
jgi:hypothetical protein